MSDLKPFFYFYGGKWRAAPKYPRPEHDFIVEPRSYSGRGMYGRCCLGVDLYQGQSLGSLIAVLITEVDEDDREDVAEAVQGMLTDSMGLGSIVYFPSVLFDEKEYGCPKVSP